MVQAEVDGELVLMSPKDFAYFGTAGAGDAVWALVDGTRTIDELVATLESTHSADPGVIRRQTSDYLDALVAAGLVEID